MSKYVVDTNVNIIIDDEDYILQHYTDKIKHAITESNPEKSKALLKITKKFISTKKPKFCKPYDPEIDGPYERFRMYYHILEILTKEKHPPSVCSYINYNFDRWADLGMPTITTYNQWTEPVKYTALILTTIANVFKLIRAKEDGGASFIGTALQGIAHALFVTYFTVLTKQHALAVPKVFGTIMSCLTCFWIIHNQKGFL